MKIAFVSTYQPRMCGIATFTRDLADSIESKKDEVCLVAMNKGAKLLSYPPRVKFVITHNNIDSYNGVADEINLSDVDVVSLQHEYGIFGGDFGQYALQFIDRLEKPVVSTLHTVLSKPNDGQKIALQALCHKSARVVVMGNSARHRLINIYEVDPSKVHIIHHGVPSLPKATEYSDKDLKRIEKLSQKSFILLSHNLVSSNKGLENVIRAMPTIVEEVPNAYYLIAGITHPEVKKHEGEAYRNSLKKLATDLGVRKHLGFLNKYVALEKLVNILDMSEIYITPYLDPEQSSSGTLAYAIGVGKPCISTEYEYAKEILSSGRGVLVDFDEPDEIAEAVIDLYKNPKKRKQMADNAYQLGQNMSWQKVGQRYLRSFKGVLAKTDKVDKKPSLKHLRLLTDDTGLHQHGHYFLPDARHGYTLDDNARALIVVASYLVDRPSSDYLNLLATYLKFIRLSQEPNGMFHNFMNFRRDWTDTPHVDDSFGKAMWALGYCCQLFSGSTIGKTAKWHFDESKWLMKNAQDVRARAFCIFGIYHLLQSSIKDVSERRSMKQLLIELSDDLVEKYTQNKSKDWHWFEDSITYESFRLPQALYMAYLITKNSKYLRVANKTCNFLLKNTFNGHGFFEFVGQDGWLPRGGPKAEFDQQPVEAGGATEALVFAYKATKKKKYKDLAKSAFEWFYGKNVNNISLYDDTTGGVRDGLNLHGANDNQGAESLVSFLMAERALRQL